MDLLCTFRRSSLYIRTELIKSDPNTYIRIGTKSDLINSDLAVRVDVFRSDLIESDVWCILTDIYPLYCFFLRVLEEGKSRVPSTALNKSCPLLISDRAN